MIWYYILTFFAQTIEGLAGFGSTVMAIPFLSMAIGTSAAVALLAINSFVSGGIIFFTHIKDVNWKEYAKVTLCVLPFIPVGILLYGALSPYEAALKLILGATVIFVGARGVWYFYIKKAEPPSLGTAGQYIALSLGALTQGMFSAGGPLIVLYTSEKLRDKGAFRATMSALWFTVNSVALVLRLLLLDIYTADTFIRAATCLPLLIGGILLGLYLHRRIDNTAFRKLIYVILLAGGVISTVSCLIGMI